MRRTSLFGSVRNFKRGVCSVENPLPSFTRAPQACSPFYSNFPIRFKSNATMSAKQVIQTDKAPQPIGPYSQAIAVPSGGKTIYLCGMIGLKPGEKELVLGIEAQTDQALKNMGEVLRAAGASYADVVKTTILLKSLDDFSKVNEIYAKYFSQGEPGNASYPARACYEVARLPMNGLIEIESIAVTKQ